MTSMNTENLEDFYSRFSKGEDKYAFFLGGLDTGINYETSSGNRLAWEDVSLLSHVKSTDAKPVIRRINYQTKKSYDPWRSTGNSSADNYYVLNETTGMVYLCLSSNELNRSDLFTKNNSTVPPTGTSGIQSTSDGYQWLPLYKLDTNSRRFLTDNLMPVNDAVRDYNQYSPNIPLGSLATTVCGGTGATGNTSGTSGACGLYPRTREYNPTTGTYTTAGSLWRSFIGINCWECYDLSQRLTGMDNRFVFGGSLSDLPTSIISKSNLDLINESQLNPSSNEKIQAGLITASKSKDGEILSLFINLSTLSYDQRKVSVSNPEITFVSATGTGATAKLVTYTDSQGNYIVDGIDLTNGGSGYFDCSATVPSISNASSFTSVIEINIEPLDGFATSTRKLLNCNQLAFRFDIDSDEISTATVNQTTFSTYGILKNPETTAGSIFGSDLNTNQKSISRNTIKLTLDLT